MTGSREDGLSVSGGCGIMSDSFTAEGGVL